MVGNDKDLIDDALDAVIAAGDFMSAAAAFALVKEPTRREITRMRQLADKAVGQIYKLDNRISKIKPKRTPTTPVEVPLPVMTADQVREATSGPNPKMFLTKDGRESLEAMEKGTHRLELCDGQGGRGHRSFVHDRS